MPMLKKLVGGNDRSERNRFQASFQSFSLSNLLEGVQQLLQRPNKCFAVGDELRN